jgi:hypothetical protein
MQTLSFCSLRLLPVFCGFFALAAGAGAAPAVSPQSCEAQALTRPDHLEGRYVTYVPNNHWYTMRGSLPAMGQCTAEGTRKVIFEQQKQETGIGLHPKLEWLANSFPRIVIKGNQAKRVQATVRAFHGCWPEPIGAYGDSDKTRHIKARMTAIVTWTPKGGQPVSKTFTSTPQAVCR